MTFYSFQFLVRVARLIPYDTWLFLFIFLLFLPPIFFLLYTLFFCSMKIRDVTRYVPEVKFSDVSHFFSLFLSRSERTRSCIIGIDSRFHYFLYSKLTHTLWKLKKKGRIFFLATPMVVCVQFLIYFSHSSRVGSSPDGGELFRWSDRRLFPKYKES